MVIPEGSGCFTKEQELTRSAEFFCELCAGLIADGGGPGYALYMLLDSGYSREELCKIAEKLIS